MNIRVRVLVWGCLLSASVAAEQVSITVVDNQGQPVPQAVVALSPTSASGISKAQSAPPRKAELAQREKQFDPHVVAVQKGGAVDFPNEDNIKHQVYSLSDTKKFELLVDEGASVTGPVFDKVGQVNVGCNIHDWMLAYIYVTDTPYFSTTDAQGKATIDVPAGENYQWVMWHPRAAENDSGTSGSIQVAGTTSMNIALTNEMTPDYDQEDDLDDFDDY